MVVGAWLIYLIFGIYPLRDWMVIGIMVSFFGNIGDLIVSMMKRSLKLKDSGSVFPGHGGFLDRFDAILFAIPFVSVYVLIVQ